MTRTRVDRAAARRRRILAVSASIALSFVMATVFAAPAAPLSGGCPRVGSVSAILVPSCGAWWGVSPGGSGAEASSVATFERLTGARTDIYHGYHQLGDMFPTPAEVNLARDPRGHRLLLLSLFATKHGVTWRDVANGQQDGYLRTLASYIASHYREKFLFTIHHEPENDVDTAAGSGMTATDFRNMFRHVVQTMRSFGVGNAVWVVNYQGTQKFKTASWWASMYPGDDVVDWIGWDSYSCVQPDPGRPCNDFSEMMNRRFSDSTPWQGMYAWATSTHPSKPLIVCELGVYDVGGTRKADAIRSIGAQVSRFPQIKAIAYWDSGGVKQSRITAGQGAVAAAAATAQNPWFGQSVP